MAAARKYPAEVRDRIYQLSEDRLSGTEILDRLRSEGHAPIPDDEGTCRRIASEERRARGSVKDMARDEALDTLTRRLFTVADTRIRRMERAKDVDPNELLTMAKALRELQPLAQAKGNTRAKTQDTPLSVVEGQPTRRARQQDVEEVAPGSLRRSA